MNQLVITRTRVEKDVVTRVTRVLGGKGRFFVSVGQEVKPEEIIGEAATPVGFRILNLSSLLSVPPQDIEKYLTGNLGQRIYQGELLASKKGGLFSRRKAIISPTDGILDFLNNKTGELRISFLPKKINLPAGVFGIVEGVDQERGQAVIKTQISRIHGMFGSGRSRDGILHILGKKDELISKNLIKSNYDGHILAGGGIFFKDTISAAISAGASGIITGGINAGDYRGISGGRLFFPKKLDNDVGISVVVCEGFGSIPMGSDIFEILLRYQGKFIFIDGNKALISLPSFSSSSLARIKRTQLPKLLANDSEQGLDHTKAITELKVGSNIRIVGNSYLGEQGVLLAVDSCTTLLPSKVNTYLATVETTRRKIQVPVANLEMIV